MEVNVNLSEKAQRDFMLVQRATNGDQRAFAELMGRYRDAIYYMLLKMVNNASDAEDLTIEAFGKAFKNITQYAPNYAFSTWLFKIATNNCIDFMRKSRRISFADNLYHDDPDSEDFTGNVPCSNLSPEEKFIEKQKIRLMREIVERLKPHYRMMVDLRYFKEFSYEEIAEKLDLPLGTVKAQLFRAREFLYHILKNRHDKLHED